MTSKIPLFIEFSCVSGIGLTSDQISVTADNPDDIECVSAAIRRFRQSFPSENKGEFHFRLKINGGLNYLGLATQTHPAAEALFEALKGIKAGRAQSEPQELEQSPALAPALAAV